MQHDHTAIGTNHLSSNPSSVLSTEHGDDPGDLVDVAGTAAAGLGLLDQVVAVDALAGAHEGRVLDPALDLALELVAVLVVHLAVDGTGVDGVDGGALRELAGPGAGHGLEGGLGAAVDGLLDEARRRRDRRQVDDAAGAVARQERLGGLGQQQRTQHVDLVRRVKVLQRDLGQRVVGRDAGVVDEYVDLEAAALVGEVLPDRVNHLLGPVGSAQVAGHRERLDLVLRLQFI